MLGYKVAEVQSEFYYCCMKNSLIGLGLKYIKIPKSLKSENILSQKDNHTIYGTGNPISLGASIELAAIELCHNKITV